MNKKDYLLILALALITSLAFVLFQSAPGYMDAEYYYGMGLRIARDHTLTEPFIWNYLNGMPDLPQPGFRFWMPLPAFLAGLSMAAFRGFDFLQARIGFVIIALLIPLLTARITFEYSGERRIGLIAGFISVFPGLYAPFLTTTDSFGLMMLFGGAYLVVARQNIGNWRFFILGLLAGLMHMTRTDGFFWLIPAVLIAADDKKKAYSRVMILGIGYLVVMLPWFIRNWIALGTLLPAGNIRMFWMTSYNDLFLYRAEMLTFSSWIGQGLGAIFITVLKALESNLQTALFIQGQIILIPLIPLGFRQYRKDNLIRSVFITWLLVLFVMTIVFPFAGSRGGFFHSGAAFQPVLWFLAAVGFDRFIKWGISKRGWKEGQSRKILTSGLIAMLLGVTVFVHIHRVQGKSTSGVQWNQSYLAAVDVDTKLDQMNIADNHLVMINNPPGLYVASGRSSITIPSGGIGEIFEVAIDANVDILVLESNHPASLDFLYEYQEGQPGLVFIEDHNGIQYYKIQYDDE